jgi:hypothetical protein
MHDDEKGADRTGGTRAPVAQARGAGPPNAVFADAGGFRVVLYADLPKLLEPERGWEVRPAWAGLWRLVNVLQSLPGLHVAVPGLEHVSAPHAGPADADDPLWQEASELVDGALHPLLVAVRSGGAPPPDIIGEDLMAGDVIVGMVEVGWREKRLGVVLDAVEQPDWQLVEIDPTDPSSMRAAVEAIVGALGGET